MSITSRTDQRLVIPSFRLDSYTRFDLVHFELNQRSEFPVPVKFHQDLLGLVRVTIGEKPFRSVQRRKVNTCHRGLSGRNKMVDAIITLLVNLQTSSLRTDLRGYKLAETILA